MSIDSNVSRTISLCRFPLIAMVVMLHSGAVYSAVCGGGVAFFFSDIVTRIAVPLFFCISGYLLFSNFTLKSYGDKIGRRIRTLFIPYLFWNAVFILAFWALQHFLQVDNGRKPIADWGISDFLWSFWDVRHIEGYGLDSGGTPFHSHLWFLRDLFMMSLCSPVFFFLLRRLKSWPVIIAALIWGLLPFDCLYFMKNESILFFLLGGYLQLNSVKILKLHDSRAIWWLLALAAISMILSFCLDNLYWRALIKKIYILSGCFVFFNLMSLIKNERVVSRLSELSESTFFVYGCHGLIIAGLSKVILNTVNLTLLQVTLSFLLTWLIALIVSLLLYYFVKRFFPWGLYIAAGRTNK